MIPLEKIIKVSVFYVKIGVLNLLWEKIFGG
jgi:hypothetical protein